MTKPSAKKPQKSKSKAAAKKKPAKAMVASKKQATKKKKATKTSKPRAPKLPKLPKGGPKDIGLLSFGKKAVRKKAAKAAGGLGLGMAGSVADRKRAGNTRVPPFQKICDLLITAGDGSLHSGTAFFISPRMLLTCGHCLHIFKPGSAVNGPVRKVLVMPARNGETNAAQSFVGWVEVPAENMRVHDRWRLEGNLDFDYGVLILPPNQALGAQVGVFNVNHFPDQSLQNARAILSGYPDNAPEGTQWFETNPIKQVTPTRLSYDIFTFGGQSGSPVFFGDANQQVACAIHNFGNIPFNQGVRITPAVIAQLNAWSVQL